MPPSQNTSFVQSLVASRLAQNIVVWLRIRQLVNLVLENFPLQKKHGQNGSVYRIRRMESIIVADEIFKCNIYRDMINPEARTLMDIGCNTGYFSLYCADEIGRKDIEGIAIDANPEMADETRWHLQKNGLTNIHVIAGLAGAPKAGLDSTFYVSPSNIASSALLQPNPDMPSKGDFKVIQIKTVDLAEEWKARYGQKRIHLLKIDVEGYEKNLILNSTELLELADVIAIEIHKWIVTPEEIEGLLVQNGFERFAQEEATSHCVVQFFRRKK